MASWSRPTSSISTSAFASCSVRPTTTIGITPRPSSKTIRSEIRSTKSIPWNQTTIPKPQRRDFGGNYTWVMSPRWLDKRTGDHLAMDTGGGPIARLWATALAKLVNIGYVEGDRSQREDASPEDGVERRSRVRMESAEMEQRDRTRPRADLLPGLRRLLRPLLPREGDGGSACRTDRRPSPHSKCRTKPSAADSTKRCAGCLSHHMVIRKGKIANYHPYPPTPWNANPRDIYGTPGPYEDAVQNTPIFEENGPDNFKGIDIMRAVRSFDPCLPCGVHMYLGGGKVLKQMHTPTALAGPGSLIMAQDKHCAGDARSVTGRDLRHRTGAQSARGERQTGARESRAARPERRSPRSTSWAQSVPARRH